MLPPKLVESWPFNLAHFYKPFYQGKMMCVALGKYCIFTQGATVPDSKRIMSSSTPSLGGGLYSFTIEFPHVYIGPHKEGYLYSVSCRVTAIHHQPDDDDLNEILEACKTVENAGVPTSAQENSEPEETPLVKPKLKRQRKKAVITPNL